MFFFRFSASKPNTEVDLALTMVYGLAIRPPSPALVSTLDQATFSDQIPAQNTGVDSDDLDHDKDEGISTVGSDPDELAAILEPK